MKLFYDENNDYFILLQGAECTNAFDLLKLNSINN